MNLYAFPFHEPIGRALEPALRESRARFSVGRFANGEMHVTLETPPAGHDCLVLGSVAPPDEHLLSTLLLSHTLRKDGAKRITALLPYLGYARHDKQHTGESLGAAWLGEMVRASGIDDVVTVDVHSSQIHQLFPVPVRSLSPAAIFASELGRRSLTGATIIAPDEGAIERGEAVRQAAGISRGIVYFKKKRTREGIAHSTMHGAAGPRAVVVDDILDTGGTLLSCCEALARAGAREITVMVTHGLFTGTRWERLWSLGVTRIYCTDTVPLPARLASEKITVLSVVPLLCGSLKSLGLASGSRPPGP